MFTLYIPKTYVDLIIVILVVSKMLVLNKHIPVEPSQKGMGIDPLSLVEKWSQSLMP